jgi:hypothetical protein
VVVDSYPVGAAVTVYYNPTKPSDAVLDITNTRGVKGMLVAGIIFIIVGAIAGIIGIVVAILA